MRVTIPNIHRWLQRANIEARVVKDAKQLQVYKWFYEILMDQGTSFPFNEVHVQKTPNDTLFIDFVMRLMFFWSGSNQLSLSTRYFFDFTPHGFPKNAGNVLFLPQDVRSKHDLYKKLIVATFNITEGKQLYGGFYLLTLTE